MTIIIIERTNISLIRFPIADCWFLWSTLFSPLRCFEHWPKTRITLITRSNLMMRARRVPAAHD